MYRITRYPSWCHALFVTVLAALLAVPVCHAEKSQRPYAAVASAADDRIGQTRLYVVRHAETAKGPNGQYIERFTPTGEAQVAALTARLDALGVRFDAVICSPAWRAMQTIKPYLQEKGLVAELWPELTETSWDATNARRPLMTEGRIVIAPEDAALFRLRDPAYGTVDPAFPVHARLHAGGVEVARPLLRFASDLIQSRWNGQGRHILVVGHFHTGSRLLEVLQGGDVARYDPQQARYPTGNTGLHVLRQDCLRSIYLLERFDDRDTYLGAALPMGSPDYPGSHSDACRAQ